MPLVVITGFPSSGKTTWALKLAAFLKDEHGKEVHVVREEELLRGEKNDVLDDSRQEKELRAKTKSEAQRLLSKNNVVIVDALNYIKGYRYEIFCMSKAVPTRQVTVQCDVSQEQAWMWNEGRPENEQYKREVFDHLVQRYEQPDPQNRWDSPFFSVLAGEDLDLLGIYHSLFFNKPPKQNLSTQNRPVSEANFMQTLEKVTSDIIQVILSEQEKTDELEDITVPHSTAKIHLDRPANLTQLTKLKRQFMNLTRTSSVTGEPGIMFVQYLNSQLKDLS